MFKLKPSSYWNIGKIENWLSSMAKKGLHLNKMGKNFCTFKKGQPSNDCYKIEVTLDGHVLSIEQNEKYSKNYWHYITNYKNFHVFCSSNDKSNFKLDLRSEKLSENLKTILKKRVLSVVIIFLFLLYFFKFSPETLTNAVLIRTLNNDFLGIVIVILFGYTLLYLASDIFNLSRLISFLSKDIDLISKKTNWRKTYWVSILLFISKVIIITLLVTPYFFSYLTVKNIDLSKSTTNFPIIRLETLVSGNDSTHINGDDSTHINKDELSGSTTKYNGSLLTTVQYTSDEYSYSSVPVASISTKTYKLRLPSMNKAVVKVLANKSDKERNSAYSVKLTYSPPTFKDPFDILIERPDSLSNEVFAAKGPWVIHVKYSGNVQLEDAIKVIGDKLIELNK